LHFKHQDNLIQYLRKPLPEHLMGLIRQLRHEYINYGSYPELVLLANEGQKKEYLKDLIGTYIYKDIYEAGIKMPSKYMDILKLLA
jgi:predicted AAA+ superfamily ATPase